MIHRIMLAIYMITVLQIRMGDAGLISYMDWLLMK